MQVLGLALCKDCQNKAWLEFHREVQHTLNSIIDAMSHLFKMGGSGTGCPDEEFPKQITAVSQEEKIKRALLSFAYIKKQNKLGHVSKTSGDTRMCVSGVSNIFSPSPPTCRQTNQPKLKAFSN